MALCYYQRLGHPEWINDEPERYSQVTADDIARVARSLFAPQRQSSIYYGR
jgi:predicted Zn-dependent peptidase